MQLGLEGRLALVTGATRGIGAAIASELARAGAKLIVTGREHSERATPAPSGAEWLAVDFEDPTATRRFAAAMAERPIDVLINNAGINRVAPFEQVSDHDWHAVQQVDLWAPFELCRALAPRMAERGFGRIVNLTSIYAEITRTGRAAYSSAKSGLVGLTRAIAVEYAATNVLVNAVAPGFVDTELTRAVVPANELDALARSVPAGRLARPEEIARVVAFLASEANSFTTGQQWFVDGGRTCS